jgi:hypothetical protein
MSSILSLAIFAIFLILAIFAVINVQIKLDNINFQQNLLPLYIHVYKLA